MRILQLPEVFAYDPETGVVTWRQARGKCRPGQRAGTLSGGYIKVIYRNRSFLGHRLAWLLYYDEWPKENLDHINGIKSDNRIANLREAPGGINQQNIRKPNRRNKLGVKGVQQKGQRFRAYIRSGGKTIYLGSYTTAEVANAAYVKAKRAMHEGCTI